MVSDFHRSDGECSHNDHRPRNTPPHGTTEPQLQAWNIMWVAQFVQMGFPNPIVSFTRAQSVFNNLTASKNSELCSTMCSQQDHIPTRNLLVSLFSNRKCQPKTPRPHRKFVVRLLYFCRSSGTHREITENIVIIIAILGSFTLYFYWNNRFNSFVDFFCCDLVQ